MRCPICDQEIDFGRIYSESDIDVCPLCRAIALDAAEGVATDVSSADDAVKATSPAETAAAEHRSVEDSFNWY